MTSEPTSQRGSGPVPAVPNEALAGPRSGRGTACTAAAPSAASAPTASATATTATTATTGNTTTTATSGSDDGGRTGPGSALPGARSPGPGESYGPRGGASPDGPARRASVLRRLGKALARAGTVQELAECLLEHLSPAMDADAVLIYVTRPEGFMRLAGHAGVDARLAVRWRQVPPLPGLPCVDTVRTGEPRWVEGRGAAEGHEAPAGPAAGFGRFPVFEEVPGQWPTQAWFPVVSGGTTASIGVLCRPLGPFPPPARELLTSAVELCADRLPLTHVTADVTDDVPPRAANEVPDGADAPGKGPDPAPRQALQAVLDTIDGPVLALSPLRSPSGRVDDYRIDAAGAQAVDVRLRRGHRLVGRRLLECYPGLAREPVWRGFLRTLATGTPFESEPFADESLEGVGEFATCAVRAAALGDGLVVSWSRYDSTDRQEQRLADMQRLGNLGWVTWRLDTDETNWSPQVFTIFDRDPGLGPLPLEDLRPHLLTEDLPAFTRAVRELVGEGRAFDLPFRIATERGVRHLRMVTEAVADPRGRPVEIHGFVQDLTAQRSAELALAKSERMMVTQHDMLQAERTLAARLQQALLPLPSRPVRLASLRVDVAYLPAQSGLHVGGDWFSAIELPDGDALFVVGDVAGHGLDAVATMAQLRFTAKGMVITGSSLTGALTRLNALLLHSRDPLVTATMVLARYTPGERRLVWAQAGHPPPLLLRDGEARYLRRPAGILLGSSTTPSYAEEEFRLEAGDRLLLYTDGLVERPLEGIDAGFARLAEAAREHHTDEPSSLRPLLADMLRDERRDDVCVLDIRVTDTDEKAASAPAPEDPTAGE